MPTSDPKEARVSLLGGLDSGGLDGVLPGGVYAVVPQSPPARFPLWANLLKSAVGNGRVCHILIRTDPSDFLGRIQSAGWIESHQAWLEGRLRLYPMVDGFAKLLFRMDVDALTKELSHWGVGPQDVLLVDAADELLSLHDLYLATSQLIKFKAWTKDAQVHVLFNFALTGAASGQAGLTSLMDHFSGLARLHSDSEGPVATLEYWQSAIGTSAERAIRLQVVAGAYQLRQAAKGNNEQHADMRDVPSTSVMAEASAVVENFTNDQVWARELQMLTGKPWRAFPDQQELRQAASVSHAPMLVLRFAPETVLAELARSVHALRSGSNPATRIVVAEHRAALRYANELMLLRLGTDAVIRQDLPLDRWPLILSGLQSQPPRAKPDVDVETALANAASPQGKGYLDVIGFLSEVEAALERGNVLAVPFALAVLRIRSDQAIADAVASARFRRNGDFLTTDGEKLFVFLNACSLTRGAQVLDSIFEGRMLELVSGVDWMASETDIQHLMKSLLVRHKQHPFQLALQDSRLDDVLDQSLANTVVSSLPGSSAPEPVVANAVGSAEPASLPREPLLVEQTEPMTRPLVPLDPQVCISSITPLEMPPSGVVPELVLPPAKSEDAPRQTMRNLSPDAPAVSAFRHSTPFGGRVINVEPPPNEDVQQARIDKPEMRRLTESPRLGASKLANGFDDPRSHSAVTVELPVPAHKVSISGAVVPSPKPEVGDLIRRLASPPSAQKKKALKLGGHF